MPGLGLPGMGKVDDLLDSLNLLNERLRNVEDYLAHLTRGQRPDEMRFEHLLLYGTASLASSTSSFLISYTPPKGHSVVIQSFGNAADLWDDGTAAVGVVHDILIGDSPLPQLTAMNSPWGQVGCREPITLFINSGQTFKIRARNLSAASTLSTEAQIAGYIYTVNEGMPRITQGLGRP